MRLQSHPAFTLAQVESKACAAQARLVSQLRLSPSIEPTALAMARSLMESLLEPISPGQHTEAGRFEDGTHRIRIGALLLRRETGEYIVVYGRPITEIIRQRFSCRAYLGKPIDAELQRQLQDFMRPLRAGPLGAAARFELVAATEQDRQSLKGLGTYGFIKGATGFIVGAAGPGDKNLEDYGYLLEGIVLRACDLGLGTCWLGGSFTKSSFVKKISAQPEELLPAVAAVGFIENPEAARETLFRQRLGANHRVPWASLVFDESFSSVLAPEEAGVFATPLEMVRLGPSASNKQPWRVVKAGQLWHFYLQRSPGYRQGFLSRLMKVDDIQRVDMGIAMCHFELAARELGLAGHWQVDHPMLEAPDELTEYVVSWRPA